MYKGDIKFIKRIESSDIKSHGLIRGKADPISAITEGELYTVSTQVINRHRQYKLTYKTQTRCVYTYTITVEDMRKLYNNKFIETCK